MKTKLIKLTDDTFIGAVNDLIGIYKNYKGGQVPLAGEYLIDNKSISSPTALVKTNPCFIIANPLRALQLVILQLQAICSAAGANIDIVNYLKRHHLSELEWLKGAVFKHKKLFTEELLSEACESLSKQHITKVDIEEKYSIDKDVITMVTDNNELITSTLKYGVKNAYYDIFTQLLIILYKTDNFTITTYNATEQSLQGMLPMLERDFTAYFLNSETTLESLTTLHEVNNRLQSIKEVSIDALIEILHEACLVNTYKQSRKYIIEMDTALLRYMLSPTGLLNLNQGFDVIRLKTSKGYYDITYTNKETSTDVDWGDFIDMIFIVHKPNYGLCIKDNTGAKVKVRISKVLDGGE